jgi:type I restriction enzyme S subunit
MGQSPPGESYNEDGVGIPMYQGNADFEFRFPKNRVFTTDPKRFAEKYDTLISVRAPVGAQNMANEECCIGRGVASLRYKIKSDLYSYTYYKIRYHMLEIAGFNDTGTVFGSIGKEDLWGIKTQIPSTLESEEIDLRLKPLNDRIIENCFQIRSLEKLRDTLLPKLMSGEVKVDINRDI